MNKYEKLIEHIINDDEARARELFHQIVVEKSREIYESLMDDEYTEEDVGGDQVAGLVDDITSDETMQAEGEMEFDLDSQDDGSLEGDLPADGMDDMDDMGSEQDLESKVMDLESELEALKAEFESLMGDEDMGDDMDDEDMDDMGDEDMDDEDMGDEDMDDEESDDEDMMESSRTKTAVDLMREYVEKVTDGHGAEKKGAGEGHEVGKGGSVSVNKNHVVAGKNDMGGSAANIAKGGSEQAPDGQRPHGKAGGFLKNPQEHPEAKKNVNKPGGNKGAQNWYSNKSSAKQGEGQTTDGSVPVNKTSIEKGGN